MKPSTVYWKRDEPATAAAMRTASARRKHQLPFPSKAKEPFSLKTLQPETYRHLQKKEERSHQVRPLGTAPPWFTSLPSVQTQHHQQRDNKASPLKLKSSPSLQRHHHSKQDTKASDPVEPSASLLETRHHHDNKGVPVKLRDLCTEDKLRVRQLVQQLAELGEEGERARGELLDERVQFRDLLSRLQAQHVQVLREKRELESELLSSRAFPPVSGHCRVPSVASDSSIRPQSPTAGGFDTQDPYHKPCDSATFLTPIHPGHEAVSTHSEHTGHHVQDRASVEGTPPVFNATTPPLREWTSLPPATPPPATPSSIEDQALPLPGGSFQEGVRQSVGCGVTENTSYKEGAVDSGEIDKGSNFETAAIESISNEDLVGGEFDRESDVKTIATQTVDAKSIATQTDELCTRGTSNHQEEISPNKEAEIIVSRDFVSSVTTTAIQTSPVVQDETITATTSLTQPLSSLELDSTQQQRDTSTNSERKDLEAIGVDSLLATALLNTRDTQPTTPQQARNPSHTRDLEGKASARESRSSGVESHGGSAAEVSCGSYSPMELAVSLNYSEVTLREFLSNQVASSTPNCSTDEQGRPPHATSKRRLYQSDKNESTVAAETAQTRRYSSTNNDSGIIEELFFI